MGFRLKNFRILVKVGGVRFLGVRDTTAATPFRGFSRRWEKFLKCVCFDGGRIGRGVGRISKKSAMLGISRASRLFARRKACLKNGWVLNTHDSNWDAVNANTSSIGRSKGLRSAVSSLSCIFYIACIWGVKRRHAALAILVVLMPY